MRVKLVSHVVGPRWARSDRAIESVCQDLGLECETKRTTSWLWETVCFKVEGREAKVDAFKRAFINAVEVWNGGK